MNHLVNKCKRIAWTELSERGSGRIEVKWRVEKERLEWDTGKLYIA